MGKELIETRTETYWGSEIEFSFMELTSIIHFCPVDQIYHGKIENIKDLVSFEGETTEDVKAAFIEAVNEYITS